MVPGNSFFLLYIEETINSIGIEGKWGAVGSGSPNYRFAIPGIRACACRAESGI